MGASDRLVSGKIPKEQAAGGSSWEMRSLGDTAQISRSPNNLWSERERRAFERGLQEGARQATAAAQRERCGHVERVGRVVENLQTALDQLAARGADAVLDLALEVARQVVRRELAVSRDAVLPVVREALVLIADHTAHPRVRLNPQDHALLSVELDAEGSHRGCRFVPDPAVPPGGCRIETPQGEVDATVATRWRRAIAALGAEQPAWGEPGGGTEAAKP